MAKTKINRLPYFSFMSNVVVVWEDAYADPQTQYMTREEAIKTAYNPTIRKTTGFFIGYGKKNGRRAIIIASDDDRSESCPEAHGGLFFCPVGMVLGVFPVVPPNRKVRTRSI